MCNVGVGCGFDCLGSMSKDLLKDNSYDGIFLAYLFMDGALYKISLKDFLSLHGCAKVLLPLFPSSSLSVDDPYLLCYLSLLSAYLFLNLQPNKLPDVCIINYFWSVSYTTSFFTKSSTFFL
jgi:hypothetical protein